MAIKAYRQQVNLETANLPSVPNPGAIEGAFGGNVARAIQGLGETGAKIGSQINDVAVQRRKQMEAHLEEQRKLQNDAFVADQDTKHTLSIQNSLNNQESETINLNGQEITRAKGFLNRQGLGTSGSVKEFDDWHDKQATQLLSNIKDPETRLRVAKNIDQQYLSARNQLITHEARETRKGYIDNLKSNMQLKISSTFNVSNVQNSINDIAVLQDKINKAEGVDEATAQVELRKSIGSFVKNMVDTTLQSDPTGDSSRALLSDLKDKLADEDNANMNKYIDGEVKKNSTVLLDDLNSKFIDGTITLEDIQAANKPKEKGGIGSASAMKMLKDLGKVQADTLNRISEDSQVAEEYANVVNQVLVDPIDRFKAKQIIVNAYSDGVLDKQEAQKIDRLKSLLDKKKVSREDSTIFNGFGILKSWLGANETDNREVASAISNYLTYLDQGKTPEESTEKVIRDQYNKNNPQAPLAEDEKVIDPKREREISFVPIERALKGVGRGIAGTTESFGAGLEWLGAKEVGKAFQEWGETAKDFYAVEDPTYLDQVYEGLGSMTTFFFPGFGISKGVQILKVAPKIAAWLGVGTSSVLESVVESGSTYKTAIENGYGDKSASLSATSTFWANLPTIAVTNKLGVFGDNGPKILQVLTAGTMEGAQEFTQSLIGDIALSDPLNWKEATTSASIGFITGGGIKSAVTVTQTLDELGVAKEFMDDLKLKTVNLKSERGSTINPFGGDQKPIEINTTQEQTDMIAEGGNSSTPETVKEQKNAEQAKAMVSETKKILSKELKPSEIKNIIREQTGQTQDSKDLLNHLKEKYADQIKALELEKEVGDKLSQPLAESKVKGIVRESTGQVKDQGGQVSERTAFLQSLKDRVKAAKQAETATREQIFDTQRDLIDLINGSEMEAVDKAKFLPMIKNVQTSKDLKKVLEGHTNKKTGEVTPGLEDRINKLIEKEERRQVVGDIKKAVERAKNSKSIAVDYVNTIEQMVNDVDLKNRRPETLDRIQKMKDFLDAKINSGEDVTVTREMLKDLNILEKKKFADLSVEDLNQLLKGIEKAVQLGETKLGALQATREAKKERFLEELKKGSVPINSKEIVRPKVGQTLSAGDKFRNQMNESYNKAQELDLAIAPQDVVFDVLDGNKNYKGPNYKIFKETVDKDYSKYLKRVDAIVESVQKFANQLNLNQESLERIGLHAAREQKDGINKLKSTLFPDLLNKAEEADSSGNYAKSAELHKQMEAEINTIVLNENELKLYKIMREKLDELRPDIQKVMRIAYNKDLDTVEDYFPFMTDFEAMNDKELRDRFGDSVELIGQKNRKNVEKGFTIKRVGGKQKIKLNALEVFYNHIDNASYLIEMGPTLKDLGDIAETEDYGKAVGDIGQERVREWIDLLARKGNTAGQRIKLLDTVRKNVGVATLGFKLSSALIQPTALMDGASLIGGRAFQGAYDVATNREWREFLKNNFAELRARGADDPAYLEFGGNTVIDKAGRAGFWALRNIDMLTASAVVSGSYRMAVEEKGGTVDFSKPDQEAIMEAQRILRRTQASAFPKDLPSAVSQGGLTGNVSLDKLLLQFQTFMINRWSLIRHDMWAAGIKEGEYGKALNIFMFLALANFAEIGIRRFNKELMANFTDEDVKDWPETFNNEVAMTVLGNVPFVSQAVSAVNYGSIPVPSIDMSKRIIERLNGAATAKKKSTRDKNLIRGLTLALGVAFRVPGTVQGEQIVKGLAGKDKKKSFSSDF